METKEEIVPVDERQFVRSEAGSRENSKRLGRKKNGGEVARQNSDKE
jgi:hypothetical protein